MSEQLTVRQFATKAIHEDNLNLRNPSILAKLLNEWGKKCWIEGTHAGHRAFKQSMEDAMNQTQTRTQ